MEKKHYDAVVCGAGIAGIAAANALSEAGLKRIALVEPGPPLGLTSDKSTECYRNWWPGPGDAMVALMNRSIDLMEGHARRTGNRFRMNRRGYVYATARPDMTAVFEKQALEAAGLGAGPLRRIGSQTAYRPAQAEGFGFDLDGADLLLDAAMIREHFGYLNHETIAVLHARRCGSLDAQQLGMVLLEKARANGVELIVAGFIGAETSGGRISGVQLRAGGKDFTIGTDALVLATGPHVRSTAEKMTNVCPDVHGGGNYWPASCSLRTKLLYLPSHEGCVDITPDTTAHVRGKFAGGGYSNINRVTGNLSVADPATGELKLRKALPYPVNSGVLTTAGGIVVTAMLDGTILAYDDQTYEELWSINVGAGFSAPPMTYAVNGKQYIAIASASAASARPNSCARQR